MNAIRTKCANTVLPSGLQPGTISNDECDTRQPQSASNGPITYLAKSLVQRRSTVSPALTSSLMFLDVVCVPVFKLGTIYHPTFYSDLNWCLEFERFIVANDGCSLSVRVRATINSNGKVDSGIDTLN